MSPEGTSAGPKTLPFVVFLSPYFSYPRSTLCFGENTSQSKYKAQGSASPADGPEIRKRSRKNGGRRQKEKEKQRRRGRRVTRESMGLFSAWGHAEHCTRRKIDRDWRRKEQARTMRQGSLLPRTEEQVNEICPIWVIWHNIRQPTQTEPSPGREPKAGSLVGRAALSE